MAQAPTPGLVLVLVLVREAGQWLFVALGAWAKVAADSEVVVVSSSPQSALVWAPKPSQETVREEAPLFAQWQRR